jgi:endonuclease-3
MSRGAPAGFSWPVVLETLGRFYHGGDWRIPYLRDHAEDPFQVLIGTILSQRTRDEATDRASAALFARYPDPKSLATAPPAALEALIRPVGFYRTKSRTIRATARAILDRFGGDTPRTLEELTSLPGVGPKTANCVLVFGYNLPGMPVDTHVHRIANRLGVVRTRTPEETEAALRRLVDQPLWNPLNPLLVQHGQNLCRPRGPLCDRCPIRTVCATGVALSEGRAPPRPDDRPRRKPAARGARRASRAAPHRPAATRARTTSSPRRSRTGGRPTRRPRAGSR